MRICLSGISAFCFLSGPLCRTDKSGARRDFKRYRGVQYEMLSQRSAPVCRHRPALAERTDAGGRGQGESGWRRHHDPAPGTVSGCGQISGTSHGAARPGPGAGGGEHLAGDGRQRPCGLDPHRPGQRRGPYPPGAGSGKTPGPAGRAPGSACAAAAQARLLPAGGPVCPGGAAASARLPAAGGGRSAGPLSPRRAGGGSRRGACGTRTALFEGNRI